MFKAYGGVNKLITSLSKDPHVLGSKLTIKELGEIIKIANDKYYLNNNPIFSDEIYDILKELLEERDPNNELLKTVGSVIKGQKVKLPYWMGSMDKIKPDSDSVSKWLKKYPKGPYVISDKLDGSSGLIYYTRKNVNSDWNVRMFTRGSHDFGRDITHLIEPLMGEKFLTPSKKLVSEIEKFLGDDGSDTNINTIAIRGEIIMTVKNFDKYKDTKKDSRSLVNGLVCRKNWDKDDMKVLKDTDFVVFEIVDPRMKKIKQFEILDKVGFKVPDYKLVSGKNITNENLSNILNKRRAESKYGIDGIIIEDNNINQIPKSKTPDYAFAFKMLLSENIAEVKVLSISWNASKHGVLVPTVHYEPVVMNGVTLKNATGFNAKFIVDNLIGPGAVIKITRSGDVIPHILEVVKSAKEPSLPNVSYSWNSTGVDIILDNIDEDSDVILKKMLNFFTKMEIGNLKEGMLIKFVNSNCGLNNIKDILEADVEKFKCVEGIKEKMAQKIYDNIRGALINPKPEVIMAATTIFGNGFGERRIKPIIDKIDIMDKSIKEADMIEEIIKIEGFQVKTATKFVQNLGKFRAFIKEHPMIPFNLKTGSSAITDEMDIDDSKIINNKLNGEIIVMTGFRDKNLNSRINEFGGNVADSITKKTTIVLTKDITSKSSKIAKAQKMGIKVMTPDDFSKSYL